MEKSNRAERDKRYREKHKEEIAQRQKEYREKHKEEIAEKKKEYREKHKEQIAAKHKEYYEKHKNDKKDNYVCQECYKVILISGKVKHEKTKIHQYNSKMKLFCNSINLPFYASDSVPINNPFV